MNKGIEGFANTSFENEEEYLDFNFPELYVDTIKIPKLGRNRGKQSNLFPKRIFF